MPVLPVAGNRLAETICKCSRPVVHDALTDTTIAWSLYNFSSRETYDWELIGNCCLLISRFKPWVVYSSGWWIFVSTLWVCFWYIRHLFITNFNCLNLCNVAYDFIVNKLYKPITPISLKNPVHSAFTCWNFLVTTHNDTSLWLFN